MLTRNIDELVDVVSKVYCPFAIRVVGRARNIEAIFEVNKTTSQPLVTLSHNAPVRIDAGNFENLFLVMHCARGQFSAQQEHQRGEFHSGQSVPLSTGIDTTLDFDWEFLQKSVRLDPAKLEHLCSRWLGYPLRRQLRFALQPFSATLQAVWQRTLRYLEGMDQDGLLLSGPAKASFDEYLLTLLLHQHPHTYSGALTEAGQTPDSRLVRRAERYIVDRAAESITISSIAADLGVSVRSLEAGFRQWRETTPGSFLRKTRLWLAHAELSRADGPENVTSVAISSGFSHLGRFSAYYRAAFGENPSETLRRRRQRS